MGRRPLSLCIGYNSANDFTYGVAVELGFRHGKISCPARVLPECAAVWAGAPQDIHYAHAYNRLVPGTLDFVEMPQTLDPTSMLWGGKHPQDLRVELVDAKNHWYTIAKSVDRQLRESVPVKYIHVCTHNTHDYSDPNNFRCQTLQKMLKHCQDIIASRDCVMTPVTSEQLAAIYRQRFPLADMSETTLTLDTRGR